MSSSGLMYAAIVAAWAVYLVPMWLRREDELNRARQTRRYAAAIKVLAHKESFERRWAHPDQAAANTAELPLAAGQGPVAPPTRKDPADPAKPKAQLKPKTAATARSAADSKPASKGTPPHKNHKSTVAAASAKLGPVVSAPINSAWTAQDEADAEAEPTVALELETDAAVWATSAHPQATPQPFAVKAPSATTTATTTAPTPGTAATAAGAGPAAGAGAGATPRSAPRTGLMVRRRRMVTLLFAVSTIGALISADLGTRYIWAMIAPAALLSAYIVWLRRDERTRAAERARRTAARAAARRAQDLEQEQAQRQKQAKADREAAKARAEAEARAEEQAQARAQAEARAEALQRAQAARRRAAAARSRAQSYSPKPPNAQPRPTADHPSARRAANE